MRPSSGRIGVAALVIGMAPCSAQACELRIAASNGGLALQTIALGPVRQVDLTYLHSVTKTPVRETLALDAGGFVQQRIEFFVPGPGLPTEALPGERFERLPDRFVYDNMQRRIGVLHMRVDPAQEQALQTGGTTHALTRWGATALRLSTHDCG